MALDSMGLDEVTQEMWVQRSPKAELLEVGEEPANEAGGEPGGEGVSQPRKESFRKEGEIARVSQGEDRGMPFGFGNGRGGSLVTLGRVISLGGWGRGRLLRMEWNRKNGREDVEPVSTDCVE